ncbi:MAG: hypothetical protein H6810_03320 [Phycisphaeraceae bacterium]|nr:MAG: hypothetical protein H6810_03320 [Phycisphaeraceae bacterium]
MTRSHWSEAIAIACAAGFAVAAPVASSPDPRPADSDSAPLAPRVDPVTASIAAGLVTSILTGIAGSVAADGRAQVWASVQADGPDGDDIMADEDYDKNDSWFNLEYYLDADTGRDTAPNGGDPHITYADVHYVYSSGAWRPNTTDYGAAGTIGGFVYNFAWAKPDTTPVAGSTNDTAAASVCLFAMGARVIKTWTATSGADASLRGTTDTIGSHAAGGLFFNSGDFTVSRLNNAALVTPVGTGAVDLFHDNATSDGTNALYPRPFFGLSASLDGRLQYSLDTLDADNTYLRDDEAAHAELTIAGAALDLRPLVVDRYHGDGSEKTDEELIDEYFASAVGLSVIAPSQAQVGYSPNVVAFVPVRPGEAIDASGAPAWAQDLLPSLAQNAVEPQPGEDPEESYGALWGVLVAVEGTLDAALDLAASTPGSPIRDLLDANPGQDTFEIEFSIASGGGAGVTSQAIATVSPPPPVTVVTDDVVDNESEIVPEVSFAPFVPFGGSGFTPRHSIGKVFDLPPEAFAIIGAQFGVEQSFEPQRGAQDITLRLWTPDNLNGERVIGGSAWRPVGESHFLVPHDQLFSVPVSLNTPIAADGGGQIFAEIEGGVWPQSGPVEQQFVLGATLASQPSPDFYHDQSYGDQAVSTADVGMIGNAIITLTALVTEPGCGPADLNHDGILDLIDISLFLQAFLSGQPAADLNNDGILDLQDINVFISTFLGGCA